MNIIESKELHNQTYVFRDRVEAGEVLAVMLESYGESPDLLVGIPAGGVPVAAAIARHLALSFDVAVVSKITLPWNTEVGFGAVAFDGTVRINDNLRARMGLSPQQIEDGIARTREKVRRRIRLFRGDQPLPSFADRSVILVDDGLASGFTMRVAIEALRKASASQVVVATPIGPSHTVERITAVADRVYCANIRAGRTFAVAEAYEYWSDVTEEEVMELLAHLHKPES